MLDEKGFDLWAGGYDEAVRVSDGENAYPFAGYREVLGRIFRTVTEKPGASVLDIGFGTGTLAAALYRNGCDVYGQDFSAEMVRLASEKMPGAHLYRGDFSKGLAEPLLSRRYDFITATYSLHHLTDEQKTGLIRMLLGLTEDDGRILIGDVAFRTREELEKCRREAGEDWDGEECYFVADEMRSAFPDLEFARVSFCAGVLSLSRRTGPETRYGRIGASCLAQLWELHRAYKEAICEDAPGEGDFDRLKLAMEKEQILFYGAWRGDALIGCCSVTVGFSTYNYRPCGVFEDFYILPEYRHRGVARALVRCALRESGVASLTVGCADCDREMYRALGFSVPLGNLLAFE